MSQVPGRMLMLAGAIVSVVGLGVGIMTVFKIPRYWTVVLVGIVLFLAGALWRLTSRD